MQGLTCRQLIVYASRLKNAKNSQLDGIIDHYKIADNLLEELNLVDAGETKVENASGGERKRLALALELTSLTMPNLIQIDEPTSGLDSNSAAVVSVEENKSSSILIKLVVFSMLLPPGHLHSSISSAKSSHHHCGFHSPAKHWASSHVWPTVRACSGRNLRLLGQSFRHCRPFEPNSGDCLYWDDDVPNWDTHQALLLKRRWFFHSQSAFFFNREKFTQVNFEAGTRHTTSAGWCRP